MEFRPIGNTGLNLSVIGLGGASLGDDATDLQQISRTRAVVDAAAAAGINWVDTSENYFNTRNEALIGAVLKDVPESLVVCSKLAPGSGMSGSGSGFRPDEVRRGCQASLRRLGRSYLDAYLLHWPDESGVPLEETWGAMSDLVEDGVVRAIGLSNYSRSDIAACHIQRPVDLVQIGLSLIDHLDNRDLSAWCGVNEIAVTIYEPLGNGILTDIPFEEVRQHWVGTPWEDSDLFRRLFGLESGARAQALVAKLRALAQEIGAPVSQLALSWVLQQPGVSAAIAGSGNVAHTQENAAAARVSLDDATMRAIEELIPLGPTFTQNELDEEPGSA